MLRHAKSPSKYTSLQRLLEIQANHYCGRDGQDYEASEVDRLIAAKADAVSDDAIEAWLDYNEQLSVHEAELEAEYFADMDSTLLESTPVETGDGSVSAAACAPWTTLVIEYTTALVHRAWGFFRGSNMKATEIKKLLKSHGIDTKFVRATCTAGCTRITLLSPEIHAGQVTSILRHLHSVRRCEATGEILSGGNHFLFVDYENFSLPIPSAMVEALKAQNWNWRDNEHCLNKRQAMSRTLSESFPKYDATVCYRAFDHVVANDADFRARNGL
jgi:hypothetical protein